MVFKTFIFILIMKLKKHWCHMNNNHTWWHKSDEVTDDDKDKLLFFL